MAMQLNVTVNPVFNQAQYTAAGAAAGSRYAAAFNSSFSRVQPLGRITGQVTEFEKSMEAANARVLAFGASAGSIFVIKSAFDKLVSSTIQVEKALADINAVLGLGSSSLKTFSNEMFKAASQTGQTFETASKVALEFARHGVSAAETAKRMTAAMELMRISGLSAGESVDSITASLNAFSKEALTAEDIVNRLTAVDTKFAVSAQDLAKAIQRVGSVADDAGVQFNQLLGLVTAAQTITARGGAVIGNAFKSIFTRLGRPQVLEDLEAIGVTTRTASGQILPMITILKNLASSYNTLGSAQRSFISEAVGGVYQVNILKAAISDLGNGMSIFDKATLAAGDSAGQIEKRMASLNETISSKLNVSAVQMVKLFSSIGQTAFGNSAKSGLDTFNKNISLISSSLDNIEPDDSTGEKIGKTMAQGIAKGIGAVLSGPGIQIAAVLLTKVFANIGKFAIESSRDFMGANDALNKQKDIVSSIQSYLTRNPAILDQIKNGQINVNQAHLHFLSQLQQEAQLRAQNASIAGTMARSAAPYINPTQIRPASGYIPNFSADDDGHIEKRLALAHGYTAGPTYKTKIYPGKGAPPEIVTVNQRESVKTVVDKNGDKATFVIPPNGFGAETIRAGQGYVPNFARKFPQKITAGGSDAIVKDGVLKIGMIRSANGENPFPRLVSAIKSGEIKKIDAGMVAGPKVPHLIHRLSEMIPALRRDNPSIPKSIPIIGNFNPNILYSRAQEKLGKMVTRNILDTEHEEKLKKFASDQGLRVVRADDNNFRFVKKEEKDDSKTADVVQVPGKKWGMGGVWSRSEIQDLFPQAKFTPKKVMDLDDRESTSPRDIERLRTAVKAMGVDDTNPKTWAKLENIYPQGLASGYVPNFAREITKGNSDLSISDDGVLKVGFLRSSSSNNVFFKLLEEVRSGKISEIDAGAVIGPKVPNLIHHLSKLLPRLRRDNPNIPKSIPITGFFQPNNLYRRAYENRGREFAPEGVRILNHPSRTSRKDFTQLRAAVKAMGVDDPEKYARFENIYPQGLASGYVPNFASMAAMMVPISKKSMKAIRSATRKGDIKGQAEKMVATKKFEDDAEPFFRQTVEQYPGTKVLETTFTRNLSGVGTGMSGGGSFGGFDFIAKIITEDPVLAEKLGIKTGAVSNIATSVKGGGVGNLKPGDLENQMGTGEALLQKLGFTGPIARLLAVGQGNIPKFIEKEKHLNEYAYRKDEKKRLVQEIVVPRTRPAAGGYIPNFATNNGYLNKVMNLETKMSGRSAIFDTKPFPHIRNASQPTFESAISDHGGLSNALGDSMRNQKKSGVLAGGFVPNFGIEESIIFGVIQAASSNLKGKMDVLSFGYDKQISRTQKLYENFDKLNNELMNLKRAGGTAALTPDQLQRRAELHQERRETMASFQQETGFNIRDKGRRGAFQSLNTDYRNRLEQNDQRASRIGGITSVVAPIAGGIASSIASTAGAPDLAKGLSTMSEGVGLAGQAMLALPPKLGIIAGVGIAAYKLSEGMKEMKSGAEAAKAAYENQKTVIERTSGALNSLQQSYESMDSLYKSGTTSLSSFLIVSKKLSQSMVELAAVDPALAQNMQQARTPEERAKVQARFMDEANLKGKQLSFAAEFAQIRKENSGPFGIGNLASGAAQGQFTATSKTEVPIMENRKNEAAQLIRDEVLNEIGKSDPGFVKQFTQRMGEGTATKEEASKLLQNVDKSSAYQSLGDDNTKKAVKDKLKEILDVLTIPENVRESYIKQLNVLGEAQRKEATIRKQYNQELQNFLNKGSIQSAFKNQQAEQSLQQEARKIGTKYAQQESGFGVKSLATSDVDMLKMRGAAKQNEITERTNNEVAQIKQRNAAQIGAKLAETTSERLSSSMTEQITGKTGNESMGVSPQTEKERAFLSERQGLFSGENASKLVDFATKKPTKIYEENGKKRLQTVGEQFAEGFLGNKKDIVGKGKLDGETYDKLFSKIQTQASSPEFQKQSADTLTEIKSTLEKGNEEAKTAAAENAAAIKQIQFKELAGALGGLGLLGKGSARQERRKIRRAEYLSERGRTAESRGRGAAELLSLIPESRRNINDPYISRLYGQTRAGLSAANSRVLSGTRLGRSGAMGDVNEMAFAQTFGNLKASGMGEDFYKQNGLSMPSVDTGPLDSSIQRAAKDIDNFGEMLNRLGSRKDALTKSLDDAEKNTEKEQNTTTNLRGGAATTPKPPQPDSGLGWKKTLMNGLASAGPMLATGLLIFLTRGKGGGLGKLGATTVGAGVGAATAAGASAAGAAGAATAAGAAASTAALTAQMGVAGKKTGVMNGLAAATLGVAKADKIQAMSTEAATGAIIASSAAGSAGKLGAKVAGSAAGSAAGQSSSFSNILKKAFVESGQAIKTEIVTPFMKMKPMRTAKGFVGGLMGENLSRMGLGAGSQTNIIGKMFRAGRNIRNVVGLGGQAASTFTSPITTGINRVGQTYNAFTGALGGAKNLAAMGLGRGSMSFLPRTAFNLGGKINAVGGAIAEPFSLAATRASQTYNAFTGALGGAKNLAAMGLGRGSMSFLPRIAFKIGQEISPAFQSASKIISPFGKVASAIGGKVTSSVGNVAASVGGRVGGGILGKALPLLGSAVGGYFGAKEAEGEGMSKTQGAVFGALTGGARRGSVFGQMGLVKQGGYADTALGIGGAAVNGAMLGGAIGSFAGPVGTAVGAGVGAVAGAGVEMYKHHRASQRAIKEGEAQGRDLDKQREALINSKKSGEFERIRDIAKLGEKSTPEQKAQLDEFKTKTGQDFSRTTAKATQANAGEFFTKTRKTVMDNKIAPIGFYERGGKTMGRTGFSSGASAFKELYDEKKLSKGQYTQEQNRALEEVAERNRKYGTKGGKTSVKDMSLDEKKSYLKRNYIDEQENKRKDYEETKMRMTDPKMNTNAASRKNWQDYYDKQDKKNQTLGGNLAKQATAAKYGEPIAEKAEKDTKVKDDAAASSEKVVKAVNDVAQAIRATSTVGGAVASAANGDIAGTLTSLASLPALMAQSNQILSQLLASSQSNAGRPVSIPATTATK